MACGLIGTGNIINANPRERCGFRLVIDRNHRETPLEAAGEMMRELTRKNCQETRNHIHTQNMVEHIGVVALETDAI